MKGLLPVVAGILALIATSMPWATVSGGGFSMALSGTDVTGGLGQALALTLLAGAFARLLLRRRARIAMSAVVGLLGVALIALAIGGRGVDPAMARSQLRAVSLADPSITSHPFGPVLFGVAGLVALAGAVLGARTAPARTRFERSDHQDLTAWEQFDKGLDPTADGGIGERD